MFKKFIKTILFATVTTFSISSWVSAKPITKNLTADQISDGFVSGIYSQKDLSNAIAKGYPNAMGYLAFSLLMKGNDSNEVYNLAQQAASKKDALGMLTAGLFLVSGKYMASDDNDHSRNIGKVLIEEACAKKVEKKYSNDPSIKEICKDIKRR